MPLHWISSLLQPWNASPLWPLWSLALSRCGFLGVNSQGSAGVRCWVLRVVFRYTQASISLCMYIHIDYVYMFVFHFYMERALLYNTLCTCLKSFFFDEVFLGLNWCVHDQGPLAVCHVSICGLDVIPVDTPTKKQSPQMLKPIWHMLSIGHKPCVHENIISMDFSICGHCFLSF